MNVIVVYLVVAVVFGLWGFQMSQPILKEGTADERMFRWLAIACTALCWPIMAVYVIFLLLKFPFTKESRDK